MKEVKINNPQKEVKEVTVYRCDTCGQSYKTKQTAMDCSGNHFIIDSVVPIYEITDYKNKYPTCIDVTMNNGIREETFRYTRNLYR